MVSELLETDMLLPCLYNIIIAFLIIAAVLNETNKVAIGKMVLKDKEHVIALRAYQKGI